jgi:transcriptional regulator with XRE-family HTH domain
MKIYYYNGKANLIGPRLCEARKKMHYSQELLAAKMQLEDIEITQKIISRIEHQERFVTDYELFYFAKVLNVSIEWLLGKESES